VRWSERRRERHCDTRIGKWAKAVKGRGVLDVVKDGERGVGCCQRREIEERLERGEALRAKIQGDDGSDDNDDTDGGMENINANAFKELGCLERDDDTDPTKEKEQGVSAS
jgi:U3 small nucleolar RNA-associated protein 14